MLDYPQHRIFFDGKERHTMTEAACKTASTHKNAAYACFYGASALVLAVLTPNLLLGVLLLLAVLALVLINIRILVRTRAWTELA